MSQAPTVVDVSFRVQGVTIPADHGYALYSAFRAYCHESMLTRISASTQSVAFRPDRASWR